MLRSAPRRGLIGALAVTLGVTGLAVATTAGVASAAPHSDSPPSVQVGWVDSATPKTAYQADGDTNLPLGTRIDAAGKTHTARVYATFDLSRYEGKKIYEGKVFAQEHSAADCTKRAVEIWRTKPVGATPTWNKQPESLVKLDEEGSSTYCPRSLTFDVAAAVQDAVAHKQRRITFEIRVPEQYEADPSYGRELYWYNTVQLSVGYNSLPKVDNEHLYNGGFLCTQLKPYPRIGGFASLLQARGTDVDEWDFARTDFAIWRTGQPEQRTEFSSDRGTFGRVANGTVPDGVLVDGKSYGWQARVGDGTDTSAWSKKCFFTYDSTRPTAPVVSSSNYPADGTGQQAPAGEPAVFTFSGRGDKDVAGFQYSWNGLGAGGVCEYSGEYGQLVCKDPFSNPRTVRAATPGGSATVTLNPTGSGPQRLTVRSVDAAGNVSAETTYGTFVPSSTPEIRVESGTPQWGQEVLLKFVPATGVTGVQEYEIVLDSGQPETRQAEADGTAYFSFVANNPDGHTVRVRSHSGNGFVSPEATWQAYFLPWPGVRSDVYPDSGEPAGGVGVTGTFTFSPPPGGTDTAAYRYSFGTDAEPTEVAADAAGRATVTWTPDAAGWVTLTVYAVRADGTVYDYPNWYSFQVAAAS
ncbi:hypothetical protein [Micromonospora wenchangensis]|uniref:hypothetical protein n=1 Tax=Micromonospora wenchangensis TaxID=1185415 RepID=UPI0037F8FE09